MKFLPFKKKKKERNYGKIGNADSTADFSKGVVLRRAFYKHVDNA